MTEQEDVLEIGIRKINMEIDADIDMEQVNAFRRYLIQEERAPATISKYLHDLKLLITFLKGEELSKESIIRFKDWLLKKYCVRSANSMLAAVNSFLDYAGWQEYKVKLIKVQRQVFCEDKRELNKEEYYRLVAAAKNQGKERLALAIQTMCGLGLRVSELHFVTVNAVQTGRLQIYNKGKNRSLIVSGRLQEQLLLYIKNNQIKDGKIFITRTGKPVDRSNLWREMKKLEKMAGVIGQKVFPHNLRHLFARTYYELKKDVVKLADILGHSNIETTRIYTVTSGKEYRQQLEALGLIL